MVYEWNEWTTPEERQALFQTLVNEGSEALYDALQDQSTKGYVLHVVTRRTDVKRMMAKEEEGKVA